MGRRPVPTAILEQHGSFKKDPQRRRDAEPPAKGRPRMPQHLNAAARRMWRRTCDILASMRVLSESDGPAIEQFATIYSEWRRAKDECDTLGRVIVKRDKTGAVVQTRRNSWFDVKVQCEGQLYKYLTEFGLTPSSRTKLKAEAEEEGVDWFELALKKRQMDN